MEYKTEDLTDYRPFVVYWVERRPDGRPDQLWADDIPEPVFLHDRFEIFETKAGAMEKYENLIGDSSTHAAGFSEVQTATDWI